MPRVHYQIHPDGLEGEWDYASDEGSGHYSRAYFCGTCGKVWATLAKDTTLLQSYGWRVFVRGCEGHKLWYTDPAGSLIIDAREDVKWLPMQLLVREFFLDEEIGEDDGN